MNGFLTSYVAVFYNRVIARQTDRCVNNGKIDKYKIDREFVF